MFSKQYHSKYIKACSPSDYQFKILPLESGQTDHRLKPGTILFNRKIILVALMCPACSVDLGKQISGTIYWPFLATNKAQDLEVAEYHIREGVVQCICLVGCKIQPVDGYVAVCLVLTIDFYDRTKINLLIAAVGLFDDVTNSGPRQLFLWRLKPQFTN